MDSVNIQVIVTGIVGLITTITSSWFSWFLAKKKYNTEVDSALIANMQESLEFYTKLSDDNKIRLDEVLKKNEQLERDNAQLRALNEQLRLDNVQFKFEVGQLKVRVRELMDNLDITIKPKKSVKGKKNGTETT